MMGDGIRSGKDGACLSVHSLAIGEEERLTRRIVFVEDTALPYDTLVHQRGVADSDARGKDEISTLDTRTEFDGRLPVGVDRTILESADAIEDGAVSDAHIFD